LSTKAIIFYNLKDVNNVNYKIMKRRSALQKIAWVSGGIAMLPYYCSTQPEIITYTNLPIAISERNLINVLSNLILSQSLGLTNNPGQVIFVSLFPCFKRIRSGAVPSVFTLPKKNFRVIKVKLQNLSLDLSLIKINTLKPTDFTGLPTLSVNTILKSLLVQYFQRLIAKITPQYY